MEHDRFDGFTVNLYLDEEDDWPAHFVELPNISAFADTPEQALAELDSAWRLVKRSYTEDGEPGPAAPPVRTTAASSTCASTSACTGRWQRRRQGRPSLNALVAQKLAQGVEQEWGR